MRIRLLAVAAALACAPPGPAADEDNPFRKVKVGDYATYKMTAKFAGAAVEGTLTQSVVAKDDKEVTLRLVARPNGQELAPVDQKIDLTKPYNPTAAAPLPDLQDAKVEKVKDGTEKIKVAGKEYAATWEAFKVKGKFKDTELDADVKVWQSKDLPLLVVKMEMKANVAGMAIEMQAELSESGNKKD